MTPPYFSLKSHTANNGSQQVHLSGDGFFAIIKKHDLKNTSDANNSTTQNLSNYNAGFVTNIGQQTRPPAQQVTPQQPTAGQNHTQDTVQNCLVM